MKKESTNTVLWEQVNSMINYKINGIENDPRGRSVYK